ncbi:uncharacterized protein LOC113309138 [Papaver somniferum]|uniref:uncharacterized protein LOC113309138 n=1 Tax=Papaver somniferum TaxID=3469 RepID=UPI000E6FEAF5|nr:uncharacterized protein LOC113309138 [Papaver somniferum]
MDRAGGEIGRRLKKILRSKSKNKGSAGTWSDGKLVTKIGRNSDSVMAVSDSDTILQSFHLLSVHLTSVDLCRRTITFS